MRDAIDMVGMKHGRLTVIARAPRKGKQKGAFWECQCDCGRRAVVKGCPHCGKVKRLADASRVNEWQR